MASLPHIPPRRLVFSGGGIRILAYLGALEFLEEKSMLTNLREVCGVSAGSLVSLMLALGYRLPVLRRFCFEYDFSNVRSIDPEIAVLFMETLGLDDGQNLRVLLVKILKHKGFGPEATFHDLANKGCLGLRVWASDIQNAKVVEFSARTTPNVSIVTALHASMAVPLYFHPVVHPDTGYVLVDGGVFDNYPISQLTEEEAQESIGFTFELGKTPVEIQDVQSFLGMVIAGYYMPAYQALIQRHRSRTICISCAEFPALHFEATLEEKQRLVAFGRQAAEIWYGQRPRVLGRRRSVV
jgi:NTE family protein